MIEQNKKDKEIKDKRVILRMTSAEQRELEARAAAAECSVSEYIRSCVFSSKKGIAGKKYCPCGNFVDKEDRYCGNCGQMLL